MPSSPQPPRTFKDAKLGDDLARKACGLNINEGVSQSVVIDVNETLEDCEAQIHEPKLLSMVPAVGIKGE
jgi:hypothetical protein